MGVIVNFSPVTLNGSRVNSLLRRRLNAHQRPKVCDDWLQRPLQATPTARPSKSMTFNALLWMVKKRRTNTDHFATSRGRVGARGAVGEHAGRAGDKCGGLAGAGAKWSEGRQAAKEGAGAGGKKAGISSPPRPAALCSGRRRRRTAPQKAIPDRSGRR